MTGNNIYLSGPEWLVQYDCDVFNAVAGMFLPEDWESTFGPNIKITADEIYRKMHNGKRSTLSQATEILASMRKLSSIKTSIYDEVLSAGLGILLLNFHLVLSEEGFKLSITIPALRQIIFGQIVYVGGPLTCSQYG